MTRTKAGNYTEYLNIYLYILVTDDVINTWQTVELMAPQLQWGYSQRIRCLCLHLQSTGSKNSSTKAEFSFIFENIKNQSFHPLSEVPLLFRSICWLVCSVLLFACFLKQLISIFLSGFNLQPVLHCWNESASVPGMFFLWTGTNKLELDHSSLIFISWMKWGDELMMFL